MNLVNMLMQLLTSQSSVDSLAKKSGASSNQIMKLVSLALPILIKALTKNASSQSGASSLLGALSQHTSTEPIEHQIMSADENDGAGILGHILGGNMGNVFSDLSSQTGMNTNQVSSAMNNLAPALMSGLSAATNTASSSGIDLSDGLDFSDLMGVFGAVTGGGNQAAQSSGSGLMGMLGSLFGGKKEDPKEEFDGSELLSSLLSNLGK